MTQTAQNLGHRLDDFYRDAQANHLERRAPNHHKYFCPVTMLIAALKKPRASATN